MDQSEWVVFVIVGAAIVYLIVMYAGKRKKKSGCCSKGCGEDTN